MMVVEMAAETGLECDWETELFDHIVDGVRGIRIWEYELFRS